MNLTLEETDLVRRVLKTACIREREQMNHEIAEGRPVKAAFHARNVVRAERALSIFEEIYGLDYALLNPSLSQPSEPEKEIEIWNVLISTSVH